MIACVPIQRLTVVILSFLFLGVGGSIRYAFAQG